MYIHIYIHVNEYSYIFTYVYKYISIYVYICICIYLYLYTHMHIYTPPFDDALFARSQPLLCVCMCVCECVRAFVTLRSPLARNRRCTRRGGGGRGEVAVTCGGGHQMWREFECVGTHCRSTCSVCERGRGMGEGEGAERKQTTEMEKERQRKDGNSSGGRMRQIHR